MKRVGGSDNSCDAGFQRVLESRELRSQRGGVVAGTKGISSLTERPETGVLVLFDDAPDGWSADVIVVLHREASDGVYRLWRNLGYAVVSAGATGAEYPATKGCFEKICCPGC